MPYRYDIVDKTKVENTKSENFGENYYITNTYPEIPIRADDNYVITTIGDRLDLIAHDFYGDVGLWWIIASANSLPGDSLFPPIGTQLRIPINPMEAYNQYKSFNKNR